MRRFLYFYSMFKQVKINRWMLKLILANTEQISDGFSSSDKCKVTDPEDYALPKIFYHLRAS